MTSESTGLETSITLSSELRMQRASQAPHSSQPPAVQDNMAERPKKRVRLDRDTMPLTRHGRDNTVSSLHSQVSLLLGLEGNLSLFDKSASVV